ncbi:hypothetical protein [Sporosarcina gallistercoris]
MGDIKERTIRETCYLDRLLDELANGKLM